jgi:phage baseplate assembly protein W
MANLLDRFNKQVVGSGDRIFDFIPQIIAKGDFKRIEDLNVIISSWNNILLTPRGTYLFDPEYGSDLYKLLFEPLDDTTVERIKIEVQDRLSTYDDRAIIQSVNVSIAGPARKTFTVDVSVIYKGNKGVLTLSFDDTTLKNFEARSGL